MRKKPLESTGIYRRIVFGIVFFFCFFPMAALGAEAVTAKGMSFFEEGRELIAREKAIEEAKRSAIEKSIGTMVDSRIALENAQVVKDRIYSRSSGYITAMEVVEERKTDFGTYEVTISAQVEVADMVDDLDRFQDALSWQKNPRISIVLEPGMKIEYVPAATKASDILAERLQKAGFRVFRYNPGDSAQMGLLVNLSLEHATKQTSVQNTTINSNEISLSARIYRPGDGEILATAGAVKNIPGDNRLQALDRATKLCVTEIWKELAKRLTRVWERELHSERDLVLIIKGLPSHEKAYETAGVFKVDVQGVVESGLILFNKDKSEYLLTYRGWPDQFVNEIRMSYFRKKYFEAKVEGITGNRIVLSIEAASDGESGIPEN